MVKDRYQVVGDVQHLIFGCATKSEAFESALRVKERVGGQEKIIVFDAMAKQGCVNEWEVQTLEPKFLPVGHAAIKVSSFGEPGAGKSPRRLST